MCLTKVYYNTYADGAQDITEKSYPCRDGRRCSHPEERRYDRKFPFAKLGDAQPESHRSLSERQPTPYFSGHTGRGSKSPSPSGRGRRHSDAYLTSTGTGTNPYDYRDLYGSYDPYGGGYSRHHSSSSTTRHDPRDRDRHGHSDHREPRLKRSSTAPHIVYMDREGGGGGKSSSSRSRSHSSSRDYSRDIPLGLVPLADEYGRRRRHSHSSPSSSRSHSREGGSSRSSRDRHGAATDDYYRSARSSRHHAADDPTAGYAFISDADERRRQRREHDKKHRRLSTSSYPDASTSAAAAYDDYTRYMPRRAATTIVHNHGDGSSSGSSAAKPKQLRWEDQVRAKRERQNAEIAARQGDVVKGILKHVGGESKKSKSSSKGKGREVDEVADLRSAVERMKIPRGRDRAPRGGGDAGGGWDGGMSWATYGEDYGGGERRKRAKVYADGYRY